MTARTVVLLSDCSEQETDSLPAGVRAELHRFRADGITQEELSSLAMQNDGVAGLAVLYVSLGNLARRELLSWRAIGEGDDPLVTVAGGASLVELYPRGVSPETSYVLSRFAAMRREGDRMVIETGLSSARLFIDDRRVVSVLAMLAAPMRIGDLAAASDLSASEIEVLCSLMSTCGVLAPADEEEGPLAYWKAHDLLFHARSRLGRHRGRYGATYPFRGVSEPLPASKPAMSEDAVHLSTPDLERLLQNDMPFTRVLENRRSTRAFGDPPLHVRELGEFLYRAARQRMTFDGENGQQLGSRPYPGGGALYELEIYLSVRSCVGLPAGFYHYAPDRHRLYRLPAAADVVDGLLQTAEQLAHHPPQVLLTIAARFGRVFYKYESMGYALVLKDTGVLYQTMYLVAEAMGLGACALGAGDSDLFAAASGLDYYAETSVGEFLIGSRA